MMFSRHILRMLIAVCLAVCCGACRNKPADDSAVPTPTVEGKVVVVNAPAPGLVRRVLVEEGATVAQETGLVEITLPTELPTSGAPAIDPQARARADAQAAQMEITAAQADVDRAAAEVQRIEPLVASGVVPQVQLDTARAQSQQAQQRLQQARMREQSAQNNLTFQEGLRAATSAPQAPVEKVVTARASIAGTVRAISVQVGQRITAGQPIATIAGSEP